MSKKPLFEKDDLEKIARYGLPAGLRFQLGSNAETLARFAGTAFDLQRKFSVAFDSIADDPHLSDAGKKAARRALGEDYLQKLERASFQASPETSAYTRSELLEAASRQRAKRPSELDAASKVSAKDSVADAVRDGFVWSLIREMDPLERPLAFSDAIRDGDAETFGAFARAPKIMRLLEPKVREEGISAWNARVNPDAAREVRELTEAESLVTSAYTQASKFIGEAAGLPGADPLHHLAAGTAAAAAD